jgi:tetratricopeptide (TPR) repeat protein
MGIVFLARDVLLDRRVAIKIIRPELATARAAERFLREARILANLSHPNVMPVHRAGEADGLFYYVMDYFQGETLGDRLKHGPLRVEEVRKVGRDLLDALEAVHRHGVVHRDIKPSNILLIEHRAVLADFGISRESSDTTHGATAGPAGTLGYMPPEQAAGGEVSPQSDLYAVGIVLYEAFTGRRWDASTSSSDWSRIPRRVVPILKRALAREPERRWPDAAAFRRKLWHTRTTRYRRRTLLLTLSGLAVGALAMMWIITSRWEVRDLAILPFTAGPGVEPSFAEDLATLTRYNVDPYTRLVEEEESLGWWQEHGPSVQWIGRRQIRQLRARYLAHATITAHRDTQVTIELLRRDGQVVAAGAVHLGGGPGDIARRVGYRITRIVQPDSEFTYEGSKVLPQKDDALTAYLDGLRAFRRNAFQPAVERFSAALERDSGFGLARWWLSNAWRWRQTGMPHPAMDLRAVLDAQGADLPELERLLMKAQVADSLPRRLVLYRTAIERYPRSAYAAFLYADELQSRGPYSGISLQTSTEALEAAVEKDSSLGPALNHLVWAYIRLGLREDALRALEPATRASAGRDEVRWYQPPLLAFAIAERFFPDSALNVRRVLLRDPRDRQALGEVLRLSAMLGVATTQADLGYQLAQDRRLAPPLRGNFHVARALALIGMGRIGEALLHFDSAAVLLDTSEARLQAAEWRLLLPILGSPGVPPVEIDAGRSTLREFVSDPAYGSRAAWVLGLDAVARGDARGFSRSTKFLYAARDDTIAVRLGTLLEAVHKASRGGFAEALAHTGALLPLDSAGRGGDPFARAVLHMKRAEWLDSLERLAEADSAQLWYENFEFIGMPSGEAQASEIDWALGTYAMWLRGERAYRRHDRTAACRHLQRVLELWSGADAAYEPLVRGATERVRGACRP